MPQFVYMRGFSALPYDTVRYTLSTNYFFACAQAMGTIQDIEYIQVPNAIVVAFHLSGATIPDFNYGLSAIPPGIPS